VCNLRRRKGSERSSKGALLVVGGDQALSTTTAMWVIPWGWTQINNQWKKLRRYIH